MKIHSKKIPRGFTLIELLVAMAITTLIVTILVSITSLSLDTWNRSRSEIRAARQGKALLDSMTRDFESLVVRRGNNFEWLHAESNPSSSGPRGNASPNAVDLVLFSAVTDRYDGQIGTNADRGGDVSTIGYRLIYKDPIAGANDDAFKTFVLYRKIVNPDDTFERLLGRSDLKGEFTTFTSSGSNAVDEEENFICENIYQFTITFHVAVTQGTATRTIAVPIGPGSAAVKELRISGSGIDTTFSSSGVTNAEIRAGRVTAVEISATVLTDFAIQQMRQRPAFTGTAKDEFIAKHSYQYSKLVPVPGS